MYGREKRTKIETQHLLTRTQDKVSLESERKKKLTSIKLGLNFDLSAEKYYCIQSPVAYICFQIRLSTNLEMVHRKIGFPFVSLDARNSIDDAVILLAKNN